MEIYYVPSLFLRMLPLLFCFTLFLIPSVFSSFHLSHHHHLTNASDQEALLGFRSPITYHTSQLFSDWNPNVSFCQWTGIIWSRRRQRVVSLNVSSMGLQGTISPLLGNLSFLRTLSLTNNSYHGHIPYQLGHLFRLKMLCLLLQGSIPPSLAGCSSLRNLTLSLNNLTGNIPSELCVLPKLRTLALGSNSLTGTIPACLVNISSFDIIDLGYNNLHGIVPSELCVLSKLQTFGIATICFANFEDSALTSTHALKGSTGYIPPEYGLGGRVTTKGDVYSYGIMLLEMLTGKKPTNNMFVEGVEGMSLPKWVDSAFPNQVGDVVDKSLLRSTNMVNEQDKDLNCLTQLISVGLLCTKESPEGRGALICWR